MTIPQFPTVPSSPGLLPLFFPSNIKSFHFLHSAPSRLSPQLISSINPNDLGPDNFVSISINTLSTQYYNHLITNLSPPPDLKYLEVRDLSLSPFNLSLVSQHGAMSVTQLTLSAVRLFRGMAWETAYKGLQLPSPLLRKSS